VSFDPAVPITNASLTTSNAVLAYARALDLWGKSGKFDAIVPYTWLSGTADVDGQPVQRVVSGFANPAFRLSINLYGAPALTLKEFADWEQDLIIGASLRVAAPWSQYDPSRIVNIGTNRWSFKPEIGFSQRVGHWILDAYGAVWFFTQNPEFFSHNAYVPGTQSQTQEPIGVLEVHASYDVRPRLWFSLDGNFWYGGRTSLNGVENPATLQQSSRIGVTASVPLTKHQSVKMGYADGAYFRFGGNYKILSVAWQYSWVGGPRR
jgi:hypothetical protein